MTTNEIIQGLENPFNQSGQEGQANGPELTDDEIVSFFKEVDHDQVEPEEMARIYSAALKRIQESPGLRRRLFELVPQKYGSSTPKDIPEGK